MYLYFKTAEIFNYKILKEIFDKDQALKEIFENFLKNVWKQIFSWRFFKSQEFHSVLRFLGIKLEIAIFSCYGQFCWWSERFSFLSESHRL